MDHCRFHLHSQALAFQFPTVKKTEKNKWKTRLSYYNVTTRLVDLVGLCWMKQILVEKLC